MHVAQTSFFVDPFRRDPEQLLVDWHTVADLAAAAVGADQRVSVIQASMREARFTRAGVDFHFIAPDSAGAPLTRSARFAALIRELAPDVFHVQGLGFGREVVGLRSLAQGTPVLLQDRAGRPPRFWRRYWWTRQSTVIDGVMFCSQAQAAPFVSSGLLGEQTPIFEIPGTIAPFTPGDQSTARALTGLNGDPAVLWVAHLNVNKDPVTVLDAIARASSALPRIKLWCCFGTSPLLEVLQSKIRADPRLHDRVELQGRVPRARIQEFMRAADLFVLASRSEGGSFTLMESLACGLPVAVSDIPSSRALLGGERSGAGILWPCGDSAALAHAIEELVRKPSAELRARARAHFDAELSLAAVGRKLAAAYRRATDARQAGGEAAA
jgi:glycosyltransferase involved in cell wall biosynthesis